MSTPVNRKHDVLRIEEVFRPHSGTVVAPVLDEGLFSHVLVRERKRSERSKRPFILLSVETKGRLHPDSSRAREESALEALAAATAGRTSWAGSNGQQSSVSSSWRSGTPNRTGRSKRFVPASIVELARRLAAEVIADFSLEFESIRNQATTTRSPARALPTPSSIRTSLAKSVHVGFPTGSNARSTSSPASRFWFGSRPCCWWSPPWCG